MKPSSYGASNHDVFVGFVAPLAKEIRHHRPLNKAWFLNYWGEDVNAWEDLPTRDSAQSTGYKLEWSRWQPMRVTDFLSWQAALVRQYARPGQFVTTDFGGMMQRDVNEEAVAQVLDIPAINIYHGTQDHFDGAEQAFQEDFARSLQHSNFLVTETNAQTTDWTSSYQFPPYDGQLREDVYTHLSNGANMVEYWHWASIRRQPGNLLEGRSFPRPGAESRLRRGDPHGARTRKDRPPSCGLEDHNQVAILWSRDSLNAIGFMPFTAAGPQWSGRASGGGLRHAGAAVAQVALRR